MQTVVTAAAAAAAAVSNCNSSSSSSIRKRVQADSLLASHLGLLSQEIQFFQLPLKRSVVVAVWLLL